MRKMLGDPVQRPRWCARIAGVLSARAVVAVLFVAIARAATAEEPASPPDGTPIVAITLVRNNIFDTGKPETSAWPYRFANAIHIMSRESFIRQFLLVHIGDPLDRARLAETERVLRATGVLAPVFVTARPVPGGAEVVVTTTEEWTLQVGGSAGKVGNRNHASFAIVEENVLGTGRKLKFEFGNDGERRQTQLKIWDPLLFGTRWRASAEHADASDGSTDALELYYPFFELATPRAGGGAWRRQSSEAYLYSLGEQAVAGSVHRREFRVWGGLRLPGPSDRVDRLTFGITSEQTRFAGWHWDGGRPFTAPADRIMQGVELAWEHQRDRWQVLSGFRGWVRQEDIPLGPNWRIATLVSLPAFGGDSPRVRTDATLFLARLDGPRYSWLQASAGGRFEDGRVNQSITSIEAGIADCAPTAIRLRLGADIGHNLDRESQLTLGADVGLRGWDPGTFDGTSRAIGNFEVRRRLTREFLALFVLGGEAFVDVGRTWGARIGPGTDGWRTDAGIGLLVEVTRASTVRLLRAEVAWPDHGGRPLFLITTSALF